MVDPSAKDRRRKPGADGRSRWQVARAGGRSRWQEQVAGAGGRSRRQEQVAGADGRSRSRRQEVDDFPFLIFQWSLSICTRRASGMMISATLMEDADLNGK
jgi:hypothetical protein